jgi:hypothetical protein
MPVSARMLAAVAACAAVLFSLIAASGADARALGERSLGLGSRGSDVRDLQRLLRQAGFRTQIDGAFGPRTRRLVITLQREIGLRRDGIVSRADVLRIRAALRGPRTNGGYDASLGEARSSVSGAEAPGSQAVLTEDGLAIPPADAPEEVKQVIAAGNAIAHTPYRYGGGHGRWEDSGYDCSGSVSYALYGARLLDASMPSGNFSTWGEAGAGTWITIYANGGHMYMEVAGLRFDTSGRSRTGSRWQTAKRSASGFTVRHPEGF